MFEDNLPCNVQCNKLLEQIKNTKITLAIFETSIVPTKSICTSLYLYGN